MTQRIELQPIDDKPSWWGVLEPGVRAHDLAPALSKITDYELHDFVMYAVEEREPLIGSTQKAHFRYTHSTLALKKAVETDSEVAKRVGDALGAVLSGYERKQNERGETLPDEELLGICNISSILDNMKDVDRADPAVKRMLKDASTNLTENGRFSTWYPGEKDDQVIGRLYSIRMSFLDKGDPTDPWLAAWRCGNPKAWAMGYECIVLLDRDQALQLLPEFYGRCLLMKYAKDLFWQPSEAIWALRSSFGDGEEGLERFKQALLDHPEAKKVANRILSWFPEQNKVVIKREE